MAETARSFVESTPVPRGNGSTIVSPVRELPVRVKKVVTTDEGKLQVVLEAEALSDAAVDKVKGLLSIQQGLVLATFDPAQGELLGFDA
jgi:hypothetical protein